MEVLPVFAVHAGKGDLYYSLVVVWWNAFQEGAEARSVSRTGRADKQRKGGLRRFDSVRSWLPIYLLTGFMGVG